MTLPGILVTMLAPVIMTFSGFFILSLLISKENLRKFSIPEQLSISFSTGIWISMTLLIPLMLNGLHNWGSGIFLAVMAVFAAAGAQRMFKTVNLKPTGLILWIPVLIWLTPLAIHTLLPNFGWDAAELHLPLGQLFVRKGILFTHPVYYKFAICGGIQTLYGLFQALGAESAIPPFNLVTHLALLAFVFGWCHRHYGRRTAIYSLLILTGTRLLGELAIEPRIDNFLALFTTISILTICEYTAQPRSHFLLIPCAMGLGTGLATKYTVIIPLLIIIGAWLFTAIRNRQLPWKQITIAVFLILLPSSFWYLRNTIQLNDPIYPYLSQRMYPNPEGTGYDFPLKAKLKDFIKPVEQNTVEPKNKNSENPSTPALKQSFNILNILLHPDQYTRKPGLTLNPFLFLSVFLPLFRRSRKEWALWIVILTCYTGLGVQTNLIRYLIFCFPPMAIASAVVMSSIARNHLLAVIGTLLLLIAPVGYHIDSWKHLYSIDAASLLTGAVNEDQWLIEIGYNNSRELPPLLSAVDTMVRDGVVKSNETVLMVGEGKGHRLKLRSIPDGSWNGHLWQYLWVINNGDIHQLLRTLHVMGVKYILYNPTLFRWVKHTTSHRSPSVEFTESTVTEFISTCCTPLFANQGIYLGRINYPENIDKGPVPFNPEIPPIN